MIKKLTPIILLFALVIFLFSCQSGGISDCPASPSDFSAPDSYNRQEFESIYQLNKPLLENGDFFEIVPLDLPPEINGRKLVPSNILSETRVLVLLYEEYTVPVVKEVGVYELASGEYSPSFAVEEAKSISIKWAKDDLLVYKEIDHSSNEVSLHCCWLKTGEQFLIHQFSEGYSETSASHNDVAVCNGRVYFDDVVTEGTELVGVNLLEYNLETHEVTLYEEDAQNPLLLDFGLAYITKGKDDGSYLIEFSGKKEKIPLGQGVSGLAPGGDELYSINNKSNDPKTGRTIWNLDSLMVEEELLLSSNAIDQPAANQSVVTWRNFTPERPIVYLREFDCFAVLLKDKVAYNTYLLGDEWGILICSYDDAPTTYYRFSYPCTEAVPFALRAQGLGHGSDRLQEVILESSSDESA